MQKPFAAPFDLRKAAVMADILNLFKVALRRPWYQNEARTFINHLNKTDFKTIDPSRACSLLAFVNLDGVPGKRLLKRILDAVIHNFPDDPDFLYQRTLIELGERRMMVEPEDIQELERILAIAEKQRNAALSAQIRSTLRRLESIRHMMDNIFDPRLPFLFDDDDFYEDDDFDEDVDFDFMPPPGASTRPKKNDRGPKQI